MKISEIRNKDLKQLQSLVLNYKKELLNLRIQKVHNKVKSTVTIKVARKMIARIKTVMTEKL